MDHGVQFHMLKHTLGTLGASNHTLECGYGVKYGSTITFSQEDEMFLCQSFLKYHCGWIYDGPAWIAWLLTDY